MTLPSSCWACHPDRSHTGHSHPWDPRKAKKGAKGSQLNIELTLWKITKINRLINLIDYWLPAIIYPKHPSTSCSLCRSRKGMTVQLLLRTKHLQKKQAAKDSQWRTKQNEPKPNQQNVNKSLSKQPHCSAPGRPSSLSAPCVWTSPRRLCHRHRPRPARSPQGVLPGHRLDVQTLVPKWHKPLQILFSSPQVRKHLIENKTSLLTVDLRAVPRFISPPFHPLRSPAERRAMRWASSTGEDKAKPSSAMCSSAVFRPAMSSLLVGFCGSSHRPACCCCLFFWMNMLMELIVGLYY